LHAGAGNGAEPEPVAPKLADDVGKRRASRVAVDIGVVAGTIGGMEARIAKLESHVEYIRRDLDDVRSHVKEIRRNQQADFRILFASLITVAIGLAGIISKGFHWF
jgi:hypothetical protein